MGNVYFTDSETELNMFTAGYNTYDRSCLIDQLNTLINDMKTHATGFHVFVV